MLHGTIILQRSNRLYQAALVERQRFIYLIRYLFFEQLKAAQFPDTAFACVISNLLSYELICVFRY